VEVDGLGEVTLPPDSLRASVSVEVRAEKLEAARDEAAAKTRSIIQALEGLQIPSLQVRTVEISVSPIAERETERERVAPPRIIGYEATSRLSVALKGVSADVLRVEGSRILAAALSSGANATSGIRFFLSKPREAYRAALKASIADAEKNAGAIAGAAKIKLIGWRSVSTSSGMGYDAYQQVAFDGGDSRSFPVEPGDIQVTAAVKARFRFVKK